jgi:G3E family GTPase
MIPVSIITGFLGSGKTTILARLIRDPSFSDTAVIINEFGDIGLDHDLIESSDESLVTLSTGCLCCKIQGDLTLTLQDLLARREAGSISQFGRVVIETSGLADPATILQSLMIDEVAAQNFALARVLTVVDASNGIETLSQYPEARKQVAVADRLVLSKQDLIKGDIAPLDEVIRTLNPSTPILKVQHGRLEPGELFAAADAAIDTRSFDALQALPKDAHGHLHNDISTFSIVREKPIAAVALSLFLEALADHCGADLLRLKGLVQITENVEQPAVIHGVQHVFHPPTWLNSWPSADQTTRMVFIVRGISREWVQALLDAIETEVDETAVIPAINDQSTRNTA